MINSKNNKFGRMQKISINELGKRPAIGQTFDIGNLSKISHRVAIIQRKHEERYNNTGQ